MRNNCAVWFYRNPGAPYEVSGVTPGRRLGLFSREQFGQLFPGDVMGTPADYTHVDRQIWWQQEEHGQAMNGAKRRGMQGE